MPAIANVRRTSPVVLALVAALAVAAGLRLHRLDTAPAGMNVDEAASAWNAWCLAETGRDQHGVRWPIAESKGFGQGTSTLLLYVLVPVYEVAGMTPVTTRLPGALAGIATVALLGALGAELLGPAGGVAAALLAAVTPWLVQTSRWGHMATLFPLAVAASLAAMVWAGLPVAGSGREPRPARAALAGLVVGLAAYGYFAIRLWLPVFLVSVVALGFRGWLRLLRERKGRAAAAAFVLVAGVTVLPLLVSTLRDPLLRRRAEVTWVWAPEDSIGVRVTKVLARYPEHLGLDFLFRRGDPDPAYAPPEGHGLFLRVELPLMLAGAWWLLRRLGRDPGARLLLAFVLLYPAADLLNEHPTAHALRSLPGSVALTLLAAAGVRALRDALAGWRRGAAVAVLGAVAAWEAAGYAADLFGRMDREVARYHANAVDLIEALRWAGPRVAGYDAVFVTGAGIAHPYIHTLVTLGVPPAAWLEAPRLLRDGPLAGGVYRAEEVCLAWGKWHFFFPGADDGAFRTLREDGVPQRVLLICRPGELGWLQLPPPSLVVTSPSGSGVLWAIETTL